MGGGIKSIRLVHETFTIFPYGQSLETSVRCLSEDVVSFEITVGFTRSLQKCNSNFDVFASQAANSSSKLHGIFRWLLVYKPNLLASAYTLIVGLQHSKK